MFSPGQLEVEIETWRHLVRGWRRDGLRVVGYGAPAKATVWLNACAFTAEDFSYVVDSTPEKQGKWIPGVGIQIVPPSDSRLEIADVVVILAHNYESEICAKIPTGPEVWCQLRRLR